MRYKFKVSKKSFYSGIVLLCSLSLTSCHGDYTPRPKAYPRVIFPEKKYELYAPKECPFKFEKPVYASAVRDTNYFETKLQNNQCWLNLYFNSLNGVLNLTYKNIGDTQKLERLIEDAHKLAFKHTKKADYIDEIRINNLHGACGLLYDLGGDAASNVQFFVTDSAHHFVRGALYFYNTPNADSMAPVLSFVKEDLNHLLKTFEWK